MPDPDFDGEPVVVESDSGDSITSDVVDVDGDDGSDTDDSTVEGATRFVVSGVEVEVVAERVQYYSKDGRLITESLADYTRKTVQAEYATLGEFLQHWSAADRKAAVIDELSEQGVFFEALRERVGRGLGRL